MSETQSIIAPTEKPKHKEEGGFSSRFAYVLTAIGSAVGFGNIWRFPYLVYRHGGLSFVLLYLIVLVVITYPIMILEMGLGQTLRGGQPQAWAKLGKRVRAPAISSWVSFNVCCYYSLLLAWSLIFFFNSFETFSWSNPEEWKGICKALQTPDTCVAVSYCQWRSTEIGCLPDVLYNSKKFFHDEIYAYDLSKDDRDIGLSGISWKNVLALLFTWVMSVLCVFAGAKILGYSQYITMTLPALFLVLLAIISATLDGAGDGVVDYIGKFSVEKFSSSVFVDVVGQSVFSASLGQGTMSCLAAHNKPTDNFVVNGMVVLATDTFFAILAGFSVFGMVGFLAKQAQLPIAELPLSGISLAFTTYPAALAQITSGLSNALAALFFMTLWLLGLSTIVTLVEAVVLSILVSNLSRKLGWKRWHITVGISAFFFLLPGLFLSTTIGFALFDAIDNYSNLSHGFVAGLQAFCIGWLYLAKYNVRKIGMTAYTVHCVTFIVGPLMLGILATTNIAAAFTIGFGLPIFGFIAAIVLCNKHDPDLSPETQQAYTLKDKIYYLSVYNLEPLRKIFNDTACQNSKFRIPLIWMYLIKYLVPFSTAYLTMTGFTDSSKMYSRPTAEYPYPWYIFLLGQISPFLLMFSLLLFLIFPDLCIPFISPLDPAGEIVFGENIIHTFDLHKGKDYAQYCMEEGIDQSEGKITK